MSGEKARWSRDLVDRVGDAIRDTSAELLEPRFAALSPTDVRFEAAGEFGSTVADGNDIDAEELLTRRLTDLLPGAAVVGEEACATDPALLEGLGAAQAWLVDPLDGTTNYIGGNHDLAVMVALCEEGRTVASRIWQPMSQTIYVAEAGAGATRNGVAVTVMPHPPEPGGPARSGPQPPAGPRASLADKAGRGPFRGGHPGRRCTGIDCPALVGGEQDFIPFWRTLPWDHGPRSRSPPASRGRRRRPTSRRQRLATDRPTLAGPPRFRRPLDLGSGAVRPAAGDNEPEAPRRNVSPSNRDDTRPRCTQSTPAAPDVPLGAAVLAGEGVDLTRRSVRPPAGLPRVAEGQPAEYWLGGCLPAWRLVCGCLGATVPRTAGEVASFRYHVG